MFIFINQNNLSVYFEMILVIDLYFKSQKCIKCQKKLDLWKISEIENK